MGQLNRLRIGIFAVLLLSRFHVAVLHVVGPRGHSRTATPRPSSRTGASAADAFCLGGAMPCRSCYSFAFVPTDGLLHHSGEEHSTTEDPLNHARFRPSRESLAHSIGIVRQASACQAASSVCSRSFPTGGPFDGTSACSLPRRRHIEVLPSSDSMPCGLPRGARASTLMMPCCTQAGWESGSTSGTQSALPFGEEATGEHLESGVPPNGEGVLVRSEVEGDRVVLKARQDSDDKSAAAAAAGRLLERARLFQSTGSGLLCMLPLGFRVMKKIEVICHQVLAGAGATPLSLPNLMPVDWLRNSNRLRAFEHFLYRLHDRRSRELFLPPTCEEAAAWLASTGVRSHRELPLTFYQIGPKFRDERRPRAGCLRTREFVMLEVYSFHQDTACRDATYNMMDKCFRQIFARVGAAPVYRVRADPGTMGGPCSHEYHVCSLLGEDYATPELLVPEAANSRNVAASDVKTAPCLPNVSLEVAHCFQLPRTYCEAAGARFMDSRGEARVPLMSSYGLGVSRLLGHLALAHQEARCISFPPQVAPFSVVVLPQPTARWSPSQLAARVGEALFKRLQQIAAEVGGSADVLLDDRRGLTLRQMQAHADLVGIPHQVIIKEKFLSSPGPARVLYISRSSGKTEVLPLRVALATLRSALQQVTNGSQAGSRFAEI